MKIKDVPQDDAGFLKAGKVRDVCYATDEDGNYKQVLSVGWDPKNEAIRMAWEHVHTKAEKIKQKVKLGKLSPLAFHMEAKVMSAGLLSQYSGFSRLQVKRHLKPTAFKKLTESQLSIYAEALNISVEELKVV
jgi:hypothetical protein